MNSQNYTVDRQTDRQTDRILWLDNARAFAILAVIFVHATENIYTMNADHLTGENVISMVFAILGFTFGRLGVPLFLFLTGYLLLDRLEEKLAGNVSYDRSVDCYL